MVVSYWLALPPQHILVQPWRSGMALEDCFALFTPVTLIKEVTP